MGFGDDIMATAEARLLKEKNPRAKIIVGDGVHEYDSPIFHGNPHINRLQEVTGEDQILWLKNYYGYRPYIDYSKSDMNTRQSFTDYKARAGNLFLSNEIQSEIDRFLDDNSDGNPHIFIEPNVEGQSNKDWGFENWQAVVRELRDQALLIQPVYPGAKRLSGVLLYESASFLHGCALLNRCDLFVGPEGGFHHAAAALEKIGVVIFGGRIHPRTTGYEFHHNIYVDSPLSPCGMLIPCNHCKQCMSQIIPERVIALIRTLLGNFQRNALSLETKSSD